MRGSMQVERPTVRDRVLTEFFRWLPALTFFAIYMATQNFLFFTYAMAFALWPCLKPVAKQPRRNGRIRLDGEVELRARSGRLKPLPN